MNRASQGALNSDTGVMVDEEQVSVANALH